MERVADHGTSGTARVPCNETKPMAG